jgi:hypothetical protein
MCHVGVVAFSFVLLISAVGCGTVPVVYSREQCGTYPGNYREIADSFARRAGPSSMGGMGLEWKCSGATVPIPSRIQGVPGWLVTATLSGDKAGQGGRQHVGLDASIVIYNGKVVWNSLLGFGVPNE